MNLKKTISAVIALGMTAGVVSSCGKQTTEESHKTSLPTSPPIVYHREVIPITTMEQVNTIEEKLLEIGFTPSWIKTGSNFSGYSLVGKVEDVDFRIMINIYSSPQRIQVELEAVATPTEAKAARNLLGHLGLSEQTTSGQQTSAGEGKSAPEK